MKTFAMLFPGQGVQYINMLSSFFKKNNKIFEKKFHEASEYINYNLLSIFQEKKNINNYQYIPLAILTSSIAIYEFWKEKNGPLPKLMSGHSLGEYSALVCSNAIKFRDALKIVNLRSKLMQDVIINKPSLVLAIIGLEQMIVKDICSKYSPKIVSIASINSEDEIIISGDKSAVYEAGKNCKKRGAHRILKLNINIPIHSILMKPIAKKLQVLLKKIKIKPPIIPVINNVDVICETNEKKIKNALIRQVYNTVRWKEIIDLIKSKNILTMLEIGPNKILTNLVKKNKNITALNTNKLNSFLVALKKINMKNMKNKKK
ncbi:ACP S-malonyltransferase [Buchnera aphidicola]|uniref:ACP S-malonyltransferase n=1 Tax=Buchnera aphidicola TaxID=9 RepID=UPI0034639A5E